MRRNVKIIFPRRGSFTDQIHIANMFQISTGVLFLVDIVELVAEK